MKNKTNQFTQQIRPLDCGLEISLGNQWAKLANKYSYDKNLIEKLWKEIVYHYTSPYRYYHNLHHIYHLLEQAEAFQDEINELDTMKFSIWYHDIIYDVCQKDNEEKSAQLALKRMLQLGINIELIKKSKQQILASKGHFLTESDKDNDTKFFLDFDLSILGSSPEEYEQYTRQIRNEYRIFPDSRYNNGRKTVLKYFLDSERIFKTDYYFTHYEKRARLNLQSQFDKLSNNTAE
jgi:predicted metal-dependent HD superfamily phosphohydrolase